MLYKKNTYVTEVYNICYKTKKHMLFGSINSMLYALGTIAPPGILLFLDIVEYGPDPADVVFLLALQRHQLQRVPNAYRCCWDMTRQER